MNRITQWFAGATAGAIFVLGAAACNHGYVEVHSAPAVAGYYDYDYYPDTQVYFYPSERIYYWHDHDGWQHGRDLPPHIHVDRDSHVALHLKTAHPYDEHDRIVREHPGHPVAGER